MERLPSYEQLYASFRWNIPARYNIAADVCDRHAADASKIALIGEGADGKTLRMTFRAINWKAGLVSWPVSALFAADAVAYRLNHVGAKVVITDQANLPTAVRARTLAA